MKTVLIVDDDRDLCSVLTQLLELTEGIQCTCKYSYAEVRTIPDADLNHELAILDVNLGDNQKTGIDVYHWLRSRGFRGQIVFFTGHAKRHPMVQAAAAIPGVEVFEKPIDSSHFERLIRRTA